MRPAADITESRPAWDTGRVWLCAHLGRPRGKPSQARSPITAPAAEPSRGPPPTPVGPQSHPAISSAPPCPPAPVLRQLSLLNDIPVSWGLHRSSFPDPLGKGIPSRIPSFSINLHPLLSPNLYPPPQSPLPPRAFLINSETPLHLTLGICHASHRAMTVPGFRLCLKFPLHSRR